MSSITRVLECVCDHECDRLSVMIDARSSKIGRARTAKPGVWGLSSPCCGAFL